MVLQRDAEGHREDPEDQEWGTEFPGPGKAEALRTLRMVTDDANFIELNTWIKSTHSPLNFRKACAVTQVADHLRRGRCALLQVEERSR